MAVLQMQRISICAMKKNRKAILERLQELGAMEIDIQLQDESDYKKMDISNSKATFEKQAQTADKALEILQEYVPEKAGMLASLAGKPLIDHELFTKAAKGQDNYIETARRIVALDKQIAEQKANIQKLQNQMESLVPWMGLTVPVSYTGTRKTSVLIGTIAGAPGLEGVYGLLAKYAPDVDAVDVQVISTDKDYTYLAVVCLTRDVQQVEEALRAGGFAKPAQTVNKVPSEYQKELQTEMEQSIRQIESLQKEIADCAGSRQDLRIVGLLSYSCRKVRDPRKDSPDKEHLCPERICSGSSGGSSSPGIF